MHTILAVLLLTAPAKLCSTPECAAAYYKTFAMLETSVGNTQNAIADLGESKSPGWIDRMMSKTLTKKDPTVAQLQVKIKDLDTMLAKENASTCDIMRDEWKTQHSGGDSMATDLANLTSNSEWKTAIQVNALYAIATFPQLSEKARAVMQACPLPTQREFEIAAMPVWKANDIFNLYHKNEVKADTQLKGKRIIVTGTVKDITKSIGSDLHVGLRVAANPYFMVGAIFPESLTAKVSDLEAGVKVKFVCTGSGMIIGTPFLRDCEFVE